MEPNNNVPVAATSSMKRSRFHPRVSTVELCVMASGVQAPPLLCVCWHTGPLLDCATVPCGGFRGSMVQEGLTSSWSFGTSVVTLRT